MELLLLLLIIYLVRRHLKKKKRERQADPNYVKNNREIKKDRSKFENALKIASKRFGREPAKYDIPEVAHCYGTGTGVAQNLSEAVIWKRRELEEKFRLKVSLTKYGLECYDPEEIVDFFIDGVSYPRDAALAKAFVNHLIQMEEPHSALILEKINELIKMGFFQVPNDRKSTISFLQRKSDEGNSWATYHLSLYLGRLDFNGTYKNNTHVQLYKNAMKMGNPAAICRYGKYYMNTSSGKRAWHNAMDLMDQKYKELRVPYLLNKAIRLMVRSAKNERLQKEAEQAGVSGDISNTICWLLNKINWPAPNRYVITPPPAEMKRNYISARQKEIEGTDFSSTAYHYAPLANAGHPESMRRLGNIQCYVLSEHECELDPQFKEGITWLRKAADAGDIFAMQDLGREVDPASMASLAVRGNQEAIMRLAMLIEQGKGGKANPDAAFFLYLLCIDKAMSRTFAELDNEQLMLKYKLTKRLGYNEIENSDDFLPYIAHAHKRGYTPAAYLLLQQHEYCRMDGLDYERELANIAYQGGFAKAKHILDYLDKSTKDWQDYTAYEFKNDMELSTREANLYHAMMKAKGFPNKDDIVKRGSFSPVISQQDAIDEDENAARESEGDISSLPYFITDDMGREWTFDGLFFDSARYILSAGFGETVVEDYLGRDVYIKSHHIHGNTACTGLHTFYW